MGRRNPDMSAKNSILRMKDLISIISAADNAYYRDDAPEMSDREYDALMDELKDLETETGIVFANSPTKKAGGSNRADLKQVKHSRPMLSARKTRSKEELSRFASANDVILSWKMDGLTLVLRYNNGSFIQALTRGEHGLVGEDVTHTVRYLRNVPKKVKCTDAFEVRGEGVVSWADYRVLARGEEQNHPRNVAAGMVRAFTADKGRLSHMDFCAFELMRPGDKSTTKEEQLDFLLLNGFDVVEHQLVHSVSGEQDLRKVLERFDPEKYIYPVDGIMAEYNDLDYGRSLGANAHHENRMLALKWEDDLYETVFRGVECTTTRTGLVTLTAVFDPVMIDGSEIRRADLHSLSGFEKYRFGTGDRIKVYKANMIIPQIAENLTQSGNYRVPDRCSCCGTLLEMKASPGGARNLYCPNESCISRNAQKIARFCDADAMNIEGFTALMLEQLMAFGIVRNYMDLYNLEKHREKILTMPGFGYRSYERMQTAVEKSRRCHLSQFLYAVGIPLMGTNNARAIDEYFEGSWDAFEKAVREGFSFYHIEGISQALNRNIYQWYENEEEAKLWRPVLKEISFAGCRKKAGTEGNPFMNANVAVTGVVNGMNRNDFYELLKILGAIINDTVSKNTTYLIVGANPGKKKLSAALVNGVTIVTEGHFAKMLADTDAA